MTIVCDTKPVVDHRRLASAFRADVLAGMSTGQRAIPARWLYDHVGSTLFEEITKLPEYYPSRTERAILEKNARHIASLTGRGRTVVEFGSGSSSKTHTLLSAIAPSAYVPIDISSEFLNESATELSRLFPSLPIYPLAADFMQPFDLPDFNDAPRLGFFPGSTIGNLVAPKAVDLLRKMGEKLGTGGQLLIGVDRLKSTDVLIPAYADAQGVTAKFNLNLLTRINRELEGTIPVEGFRHRVRWNVQETRIEMHLEAIQDVEFTVADIHFRMNAGETIHTENSIKYGPRDARVLLRAGGWTVIEEWVDDQNIFAVILAERKPERAAP